MPTLYSPTSEQMEERRAARVADAKAQLGAILGALEGAKGMPLAERAKYMSSVATSMGKWEGKTLKDVKEKQDAMAEDVEDREDAAEWDRRNEITYRQNLKVAGIKDEQAARRAEKDISQADREKFDAARDLIAYGREMRTKANTLKSRLGKGAGTIQVMLGAVGFENDVAALDEDLKTYQRKIARANEKGLLTDSDISGYKSAAPSVKSSPKYFFEKLNTGIRRIEDSVQRSMKTLAARGADVRGYDDLMPSAGVEVSADDLE